MGKIALLFPGQGSQEIGMGLKMRDHYKSAQKVFDEADDTLRFPLSSICFHGPENQLKKTMNAQPALLTTSIASLTAFNEAGIHPDYMAGHSLGEYTALVASGVLSFRDAVKIVHKRGLFMEEAVPEGLGTMAAVINLDKEKVIEVCKRVQCQDYVVEPANFNSPGQVVIAGHKEAVEEARQRLLEVGARKVILLPVSGPFHTSLMKKAGLQLEKELKDVIFLDPHIPVVSNVTARPVMTSEISNFLVRQVYSPVLWEDTIRYLLSRGVEVFIEIGSKDVLSRLVKKIERSVKTFTIQDPESCESVLSEIGGNES